MNASSGIPPSQASISPQQPLVVHQQQPAAGEEALDVPGRVRRRRYRASAPGPAAARPPRVRAAARRSSSRVNRPAEQRRQRRPFGSDRASVASHVPALLGQQRRRIVHAVDQLGSTAAAASVVEPVRVRRQAGADPGEHPVRDRGAAAAVSVPRTSPYREARASAGSAAISRATSASAAARVSSAGQHAGSASGRSASRRVLHRRRDVGQRRRRRRALADHGGRGAEAPSYRGRRPRPGRPRDPGPSQRPRLAERALARAARRLPACPSGCRGPAAGAAAATVPRRRRAQVELDHALAPRPASAAAARGGGQVGRHRRLRCRDRAPSPSSSPTTASRVTRSSSTSLPAAQHGPGGLGDLAEPGRAGARATPPGCRRAGPPRSRARSTPAGPRRAAPGRPW